MKRIAIMLLFSVLAVGQAKEYWGVTVDNVTCPPHAICHVASDDLDARVAKLEQRTALQLRVLGEFSLMEVELKGLHDKRVERIIDRHLAEIEKLVVEMKALDGK